MKNFQPGGLRNRRDDIGGRPRGDVNSYAPKNRGEGERPRFERQFSEKRSTGFNPKDRAPRETKMYAATCTTCGKACEVPFRPDGQKPVLCRDCYQKKSQFATNSEGSPERFTNNEMRGRHTDKPSHTYEPKTPVNNEIGNIVKQLSTLETKVNQILELINASQKLVETLPTSVVKKAVETKAPAAKPAKVAKSATKVTVKKAPAKKAVAKKAPAKKAAKKTK